MSNELSPIVEGQARQDPFTLANLLENFDGQFYGCRQELDIAVVEATNANIINLPIGFSYKDAIDGALERGWLFTRPRLPGVVVKLVEEDKPKPSSNLPEYTAQS
ncbi:MAG: hypothetical protein ACHQT9_03335 [Candidatus Saccharimonadales bacterium]